MFKKIYYTIAGDPNQKQLVKINPIVTEVRHQAKKLESLSDSDLKNKTLEFKGRIEKGESLDSILPEAYAAVCDACRRLKGKTYTVAGIENTWNMVPYDVQIAGAIVLHRGNIAEMKTGEGKTLVCTMPLYLNALAGKGAHLVTVNDYLAKRDAHWMGMIYEMLGLKVGVVVHGISNEERKAAYAADITYGTNNEFGFDYLRDNMAEAIEQRAQRELNFAIVDEVDSILIDEARTPLIISAAADESTDKYVQYSKLIPHLEAEKDYEVDEKQKASTLTESGIAKLEQLLGMENIYTEAGFTEVHHIEQALKAHTLFLRDRDYVIKDGEVLIVDEFTGRLMPGRRYSDGLHQAIEAKEGVEVKRESRTLATITFQNYFRMYKTLAGMTGTAKTEEEEFYKIYGLDVVVVPTNLPIQRNDLPDRVFKNERGKFKAVVKEIKRLHESGQPVLVGTISVEKSEVLSELLAKESIPHTVLNAKYHEKEAEIVAKAGQRSAVTIATNMAGRGTDIVLGENVKEVGGLHILGTERHESRRIDNQLRGRAGRQGDPGSSQFYVSMQDDLMRLFGSDRVQKMMEFMKIPEDEPIENKMISRSIESAQIRVEGHNFDIRKHVLEYDDVMNKQREIIYSRRKKMLESIDVHDDINKLIEEEVDILVKASLNHPDGPEIEGLVEELKNMSPDINPTNVKESINSRDALDSATKLATVIQEAYEVHAAKAPSLDIWRQVEKSIYLRTLDRLWMDHIDTMSHLREGVALRGYAQRNPLVEYKGEGFQLFERLIVNIRRDTVRTLFRAEVQSQQAQAAQEKMHQIQMDKLFTNEEQISDQAGGAVKAQSIAEKVAAKSYRPSTITKGSQADIGRNDLCPCGSGKKYKKCHGK